MKADIDKSDDIVLSNMSDCGCNCGVAGNCGTVKAAEPIPKDDETHGDYMSRCEEAGYTTEECMAAHEGHDFKEAVTYDTCPPGKEMRDGKCQRVAVTLDIDILEVQTQIQATTGKTIIRISGTAFHEGVNKNSWGIRPELAARLADEMIGSDVTLNHPSAEMGRFQRNMDGGVDEAVIGVITEASYHSRDHGYIVKYVADIYRPELFEALESGLWMRPDYGVSIGGTGIPTEVIEADEGERPIMWFADDFQFDHLAIVHKPAYEEANIETVEKVELEATFKCQTEGRPIQSKVNKMTEDITEIENEMASEMESLKASLVLREARIAEFEATEVARVEEGRKALVNKATEMGLSGHDDFSIETLESMIASWESSRPEPVAEPVIEMAPAEPATTEPVEASEEVSEPVVANYLNGVMVESSESLYARCYNSWVNAYNGFIATDDKAAQTYEELKQ